MIRSRETAPPVAWGDGCEAWALHDDKALSMKHERMPPYTSEVRHVHETAQQFFFVLSGALKLEVDGEAFVLRDHEGLSVPPRVAHQAINDSSGAVTFLVISTPTTDGDRIEL